MPINILMPALSPTMEVGNLAKWHVKEGDEVSAGDVIAEIETDKATMEVEAVDEGTVAKIVVAEGAEEVPVNQVIAVLAGDGEEVSSIEVPAPEAAGPLCEQIADAVVTAVGAAVETGYIDGTAVGVMGHSYGGYTTASLMTCTDRFAAGVSVAGFYNLASYPLNLKHRDRYNGHALGALSGLVEAESLGKRRLFQFNSTPWQNVGVYIENSPVFNMDKLSAPLLLVHGELDGVPIEQAEQMYVAGRRLSKDVTFVRYWGEYHLLYSPANIRDFWSRTLGFLNEHLGSEDGE